MPIAGLHFDISGALTLKCYGVLTLTNGSATAVMQFRDAAAHAWYSAIQTNVPLAHAFTGATTKIAIMSDPHCTLADADAQAVVDDIDTIEGISKAFVLGDIVKPTAAEADYNGWLAIRATSSIAAANWHEIAGNHDNFANFCIYLGYTTPYYTVPVGNCLFILISSNIGPISYDAAFYRWFERQLLEADRAGMNAFICTHHACLGTTRKTNPTAGDASSGYCYPAGKIEAILMDYPWCAWFAGHSHGYSGVGAPDATCVYDGAPILTPADLTNIITCDPDSGALGAYENWASSAAMSTGNTASIVADTRFGGTNAFELTHVATKAETVYLRPYPSLATPTPFTLRTSFTVMSADASGTHYCDVTSGSNVFIWYDVNHAASTFTVRVSVKDDGGTHCYLSAASAAFAFGAPVSLEIYYDPGTGANGVGRAWLNGQWMGENTSLDANGKAAPFTAVYFGFYNVADASSATVMRFGKFTIDSHRADGVFASVPVMEDVLA
jgi:hypothetical protein